ncbi:MAG: hypothetical protein ACTHU0_09860 [Kofleriaceae bacterium]
MRLRLALLVMIASCSSDSDVSREVGARCDSKADCDDRCLAEADGYPGGFCTIGCELEEECPTRTSCIDREGGTCLWKCNLDSDCGFLGEGWVCREQPLRQFGGRPEAVCIGG